MLLSLCFALCFARIARAITVVEGPHGSGLIGYGINMYDPVCATACRDNTPMSVPCDEAGASHHGMVMENMAGPTCLAMSEPYLQTVAYCISLRCDASVTLAEREDWWMYYVAGRVANPPHPLMNYTQSLDSIKTPPTISTLPEGEDLTIPLLIDEEGWARTFNAETSFQTAEKAHSTTAIILMVTCIGIPILLSFLRFLPFPPRLITFFYAYLIDPPLVTNTIHIPFYGNISSPARGQALFMLYIVLINIILNCVGFQSRQPNAYFTSTAAEMTSYISNRAGCLSYANIVILILFAGRNNLLLFLTDFSHATFLMLHKVIGIIAVIQACLHSAMYLQIRLAAGTYTAEAKLPYWWVGIIATLAMSLILPFSIRPIRQKFYELFLVTHVALSILVVFGIWYHIIWRFGWQWGYTTYVLIAIAFWAFDRLVRILKVLRHGIKYATIHKLDDDYLRIDIQKVNHEGHLYLYFPTLSWKFYESHPFSVAANNSVPLVSSFTPVLEKQDEKSSQPANEKDTLSGPLQKQISLFVRIHHGTTKLLSSLSSLPVLMETYRDFDVDLYNDLRSYPHILCIVGGVGITAALPLLSSVSKYRSKTTKLYWGTRSAALVHGVEKMLQDKSGQGAWKGIDAHISTGERLDLARIIAEEVKADGTLVFVCGPTSMAQEARALVARREKESRAVIKFVEERFGW